MGRTVDRIYEQALLIKENLSLFVDPDFILGIMKPFREELPPYAEFHTYHYGTKTQYRHV